MEWTDIKSHPERMSNLRKFVDNYDWSGLEFPVSIKDIGVFETNNNILVNMLALEGRDIHIHRKGWWTGQEINLLLISENGITQQSKVKADYSLAVILNISINSISAKIAHRVLHKN